jgi:hypothetical protein
MKKIKYEFIGWCKDGQSDKIWGIIELIKPENKIRLPSFGKYLLFWGRRGNKYQTRIFSSMCPKQYYSYSIVSKKIEEKIINGYKKIDTSKLEEIYPEFEKDLLDLHFWTMMTKTDKLSLEEWEQIKKNIL